MTTDLKPCPFCGSTEADLTNMGGIWWGICENCESTGPERKSSTAAINAWNVRTTPPAPDAAGLVAARVGKLVMAMAGIAEGIYSEEGAADVAHAALAAYRAAQPDAGSRPTGEDSTFSRMLSETRLSMKYAQEHSNGNQRLFNDHMTHGVSALAAAVAALAQERHT